MLANVVAKRKAVSAQIQPNVVQVAACTMFAQPMSTVMGRWPQAIPALSTHNVAQLVAKTIPARRVTCAVELQWVPTARCLLTVNTISAVQMLRTRVWPPRLALETPSLHVPPLKTAIVSVVTATCASQMMFAPVEVLELRASTRPTVLLAAATTEFAQLWRLVLLVASAQSAATIRLVSLAVANLGCAIRRATVQTSEIQLHAPSTPNVTLNVATMAFASCQDHFSAPMRPTGLPVRLMRHVKVAAV